MRGARLDVLALGETSHGAVQRLARALAVVALRCVAVGAQPHLGAGGKLPAHGLDDLLRQLILHAEPNC